MARRSARLASAQKAKEPSVEAPAPVPTPAALAAVIEQDDSQYEDAVQSMDAIVSSPVRVPKTPGSSSPIKPPATEMHPAKFHATMAPPSSGLRLGFTDIKPSASRDDNLPAAFQTTPSKIAVPSTPFTFRQPRPTPSVSEMNLSADAQRLMEEMREKAAVFKVELAAKREAEKALEEQQQAGARRIASAKGKAGRYSAAHMTEFKKMDSIANHPSAFRAQPGRTPPLKAGIKRSQSKANLDDDEAEPVRSKQPTPASALPKIKPRVAEAAPAPASPVKRVRQTIEQDASSSRPVSRDASSIPIPKSSTAGGIPRSKSTFASLMTPTKSSLARSSSAISKTPVRGSLIKSPSKPTFGSIARSATTSTLTTTTTIAVVDKEAEKAADVTSPKGRFEKMRSLFSKSQMSATKSKSTLPMPSALGSKTPGPVRLDKDLPPVPMTTPARKLTKRVAFTPDTRKAALTQNSPSPVKSSAAVPGSSRQPLGEVHYPSLDGVLSEMSSDAPSVEYPDLSASTTARPLPEPPKKAGSVEPTGPGTFTFRSDHTISFGSTSPSFGTSPGQASIRPVRPSILPSENMPGSFPRTTSMASVSSPNKENVEPRPVAGPVLPNGHLPHGMINKKRHRVSTDEEEAEEAEAERAAKKRKHENVPEGEALLAPRLVAGSASVKRSGSISPRKLPAPSGSMRGASASPTKKRTGISLSRLSMLARPKMRK
ncbi:hypothetical protein QBC35DRAFT_186973 [Podospora australis]|uniref:Erythromycin esterase n=1 Tax=Podospora australis TaxID=1536484 RepID=A0AAN6WW85_9PEZI|nr:hypothetical protein QBC35DRAFT_186973 [Podospora australis]